MNERILRFRLATMMFLQFLALPVWFIPLLPYVTRMDGGGSWVFACGLLMGIGTFASPIVCMFADRYFNAERVLATCNAIAALTLGAAFFTTSPALVFALLFVGMLAYMPTWSISSAIAMEHISAIDFPKLRVFGSLGWVASAAFSVIASKCFGVRNFDATAWIFAAGAGATALAAVFTLTLPATAPKAAGTPLSLADAFGLKALSLFRKREFSVFMVLFFLSQIVFQWYMAYNSIYLAESGFRYLTLTQNLGQVAEIGSMLLIPFLVRRFGYRLAFAGGAAAIALRYALFLISVKTGFAVFDIAGILLQGFVFGLTIILAQMYVGDTAPAEIRSQAQGLVMLVSCGIGVFASNLVFHNLISASAITGVEPIIHNWTIPFAVAAIVAFLTTAAILKFFRPAISSNRQK